MEKEKKKSSNLCKKLNTKNVFRKQRYLGNNSFSQMVIKYSIWIGDEYYKGLTRINNISHCTVTQRELSVRVSSFHKPEGLDLKFGSRFDFRALHTSESYTTGLLDFINTYFSFLQHPSQGWKSLVKLTNGQPACHIWVWCIENIKLQNLRWDRFPIYFYFFKHLIHRK